MHEYLESMIYNIKFSIQYPDPVHTVGEKKIQQNAIYGAKLP